MAEPTLENSILDVVIASQEYLINNVTIDDHLGSYDHKVVHNEINKVTNIVENRTFMPNFMERKLITNASGPHYHIVSSNSA